MKRLRIVLAVLLIAAVLCAAHAGISAFLAPNLALEKEAGLEQNSSTIEARGWPEGDAFHLGDSFSYFIEVKYNTQTVEEIDKTSIDRNLVLEPFTIVSQSEKEFKINSHTKVFRREYKIQAVSVELDKIYFFPTVPLRYKLKNSGYFDRDVVLKPIPMGSRFPKDVKGIGLKPIDGTIMNKSRQYFPILVIGLGIFCGAWGMVEIFRKITRRRKEAGDLRKKLEGIEDIFQAYQDLAARKDQPKAVLHQAHQILRTLLSRKEGIDWPDPKFDNLPPAVKCKISRILHLAQKAYGKEELEPQELAEALQALGKIFDFYVGKGEEQWKN